MPPKQEPPMPSETTAVTAMPPVAPVADQDKAMKLRKRTLRSLNELTPELRLWVVACLKGDLEKASA